MRPVGTGCLPGSHQQLCSRSAPAVAGTPCADEQPSVVDFANALAYACADWLGLRHGAHGETGTGDGGGFSFFSLSPGCMCWRRRLFDAPAPVPWLSIRESQVAAFPFS